jgi:hypothetical protein
MIFKHYILAEHDSMAKRFIRERSNIGMIPATVRTFLNELYFHPLFALETKQLSEASVFSEDVLMASIGQSLDKDNYFKEALEIRGNRRLLLNALLELKLSGVNETNISLLELENAPKAKSLIELYTKLITLSKGEFHYPDMVLELQVRIGSGKYDKIFSSTKLSFLTEVDARGAELSLLNLIKSKVNVIALEHKLEPVTTGVISKFQEYLASAKKSSDISLDNSLSCQSAITKETIIYKVLSWMNNINGSNKNTDVVLLNYDELAPEFYRISEKLNYPIFLASGLKCLHFSFFTQIMTVLAGYAHLDNVEYIEKAQKYLIHMNGEIKENAFRKKALSILNDLKSTLIRYKEINVHIDVHQILVRELKNTRLSAKDLEMDESGLWISEAPHVAGLILENVVLLGLENSNYPKKKRIDPVLKSEEREQIKDSVSASLSSEQLDLWELLIEKLCGRVKGNLFLGYNSHDLTSGKLIVPSSFFNHVLSFLDKDITIENIYRLCLVTQSFLEDIDHHNEFYPLKKESTLAERLEDRRKNFLSGEVNNIDFGVHDEIRLKLSSSSLETFYACPYKFHLKYHHKLSPRDLARGDNSRWLDDKDRGTFIHKLYENLLLPFKTKANYSACLKGVEDKTLKEILATVITHESFLNHNPDIASHVKEAELEEILENAKQFLSFEKEYAISGFYPLYLEHPFEFEIDVKAEKFKFSGTIDRVDTDGKGNFRVIDYKTGKNYFQIDQTNLFSTQSKDPKPYFQHAIYSLGLKDIFAKEQITFTSIEAGYYFTSEKGEWRRVLHTASNASEEFKEYLAMYLNESQTKQYFKNAKSCTFCEFKGLCKGEPRERAKKASFDQIDRINALLMKELENA